MFKLIWNIQFTYFELMLTANFRFALFFHFDVHFEFSDTIMSFRRNIYIFDKLDIPFADRHKVSRLEL